MRRTITLVGALVIGGAACGGPQPRTGGPNVARDNEDPSSPVSYHAFLIGDRAALAGDYALAEASLLDAAHADPSSGRPWQRLAEVRLDADDPEGAQEAVAEAIDRDGATDPLVILNGRALEAAGDIDEALAWFVDHGYSPRTEAFYLAWAAAAFRAEAPEAQRAASDAFTSVFPENPAAWHYRAEALRADEDFVGAASAYTQAFTAPGGSANDALAAITIYRELGEEALALDTADQCIQRYREAVACYTERLLLLDAQAPYPDESTETALDRLAGVASRSNRELQIAGRTLGERGRSELVAALLASVTDARPFNTTVLEGAAWVAYGLEDRHLAIDYMQRSLNLDPTNVNALNFIGYAWAELDENLDQAEVYVREALGIRPDDPNIMDSLAWVLYRMDRHDEALEVQLAAVAGDDENPVLLDHLGDIYTALGQPDDARDAWSRALDVVGDNDGLRTSIEAKLAGD